MAIGLLFFVTAVGLASHAVGWRPPRSDDGDPNVALLQTMASRLDALEADLAVQKHKVTLLEGRRVLCLFVSLLNV